MEYICLYIITFAAIIYVARMCINIINDYRMEVRRKNLWDDFLYDLNGKLDREIYKLVESETKGAKKNVKTNSKKKR